MLLSFLRSSLRIACSVGLILFSSRFLGDCRSSSWTSVEAFVIVPSKRYYDHLHFASLTPRGSPLANVLLQTRRTSSAGGRRSFVGCWQKTKPTDDKVAEEEEEDKDGGWGFDVDDELVAQAERELSLGTKSTTTTGELDTKQQERDWFIPVFALVSIAGFAGLYTYELFRLYFAGELYLPFLH